MVGGVKVLETAADLALMAAVISSLRNRPLDTDLTVFGEVGLSERSARYRAVRSA